MKKIYCILAIATAMLFAAEASAQIGVGVGYNFGLLNRNVGVLDLTYHTGVFYAGVGYSS